MIKFKFVPGEEGYLQSKEFRKEILLNEMKYNEDKDEYDNQAIHIIGRENDIVMCYGRLYKTGDYVFSIDKVCVNKEDRMQYVGDTIMRALEDRAVGEIAVFITTVVPEPAWEFFTHEGYEKDGDEFLENGISYLKMTKDLTKIRGCRGGCHK